MGEGWGGSVPGFELLEVLGVGERAEVYRARMHARAGGAPVPPGRHVSAVAGGGDASPARRDVVVKVFAPGVRPTPAEREVLAERPIAAMPVLLGETVTADGCAAVVMTFCSDPTLRIRAALAPAGRGLQVALGKAPAGGRAPTPAGAGAAQAGAGAAAQAGEGAAAALDGPLVGLVESLHRAGWAHGGIDAASVLVGDDGLLTLVGFGRAKPRGDPAFDVAVVADLRAARALGPLSAAVEPAPIAELARDPVHGVGAEWVWDDDPEVEDDVGEPRFVETVEPALLAVTESAAALRGLVGRRGRALVRGRGRRIMVGAAAALVVMVAVWLTLPPPRDDASADGVNAPSTSSSPSAAVSHGANPAGANSAGEVVGRNDVPNGANTAILDGDDPVAAARELLRLRDACLMAADAACLGSVDQWGSPAEEADRALLARAAATPPETAPQATTPHAGSAEASTPHTAEPEADSSGGPIGEGSDPSGSAAEAVPPGEVGPGAGEVRLVQRVGGVALLEVVGWSDGGVATGAGAQTKPVPLLVIRGGTGWRIRSFGVDP